MDFSKRSVLRSGVRLCYTLSIIAAVLLLMLLATSAVGASPTFTPIPVSFSEPYRATPVPLPAISSQRIVIDSPAADTIVGSPLTITGFVDHSPWRDALAYRVVDDTGKPLGVGTFPVSGVPGAPVPFVAAIEFRQPPAGGPIHLDLFDRHPGSPEPIALTSVSFYVARPQAITIESPAPGSASGGTVTIEGQTGRLPSQARLIYTVSASDGRLLGRGEGAVPGAEGRPAFFRLEVSFPPPPEGDTVTVAVYDQDPATGAAAASASLPLTVAPQPQRILIDTPAEGARVGSPVLITGRTVRYPAQGTLGYTIYDARNTYIGAGVFPVAGSPQTGGSFIASLSFAHPPQGGPLRVELYDMTVGRQIVAMATLPLRAVSLLPAPTPVPPTATPAPAPPAQRGVGEVSPVALLTAFYDAINQGDYGRAYGYWVTPPGDYASFARGYLNTLRVQLVVEPPVWTPEASGKHVAVVPASLVARHLDGSMRAFAGCYVTEGARPAVGQALEWRLRSAAITELSGDQDLLAVMDSQCTALGLPLPSGRDGNDSGPTDPVKLLGLYYRALNYSDYVQAYRYWDVPPVEYLRFVESNRTIARVRVLVQPSGITNGTVSRVPTALVITRVTGEVELAAGCSIMVQQQASSSSPWALRLSTVGAVPPGSSIPAVLASACDVLR